LIDPPQLPEEPVKPNRPAIFFLGLILAMGSGLGYAVMAESVDNTVRGRRSISAGLNTVLLSIIPYKENLEDVARKTKIRKRVVATVAISVVVVVILAHLMWTPLDVLWFKGLRKAGDVIGG
jgi:uncharacterized protein involved in exopolysaccharide biosynthesis